MLANRILDRLDKAWPKALIEAGEHQIARWLIAYQSGAKISQDQADLVAEKIFLVMLLGNDE